MSPNFDPAPRPALRKAPDANVHPTTHVASAHTGDAVLEGKKVAIQTTIPKQLRMPLVLLSFFRFQLRKAPEEE